MNRPAKNDVVVRQKRGKRSMVYVLGTLSARDQFYLPNREEAVSTALGFAKLACLAVWFTHGKDEFELLGSFREEAPGSTLVLAQEEVELVMQRTGALPAPFKAQLRASPLQSE